MLTDPKDPLGYTHKEILSICRERKIHHKKFWKTFGVNTVTMGVDGKSRYYKCDVERALHILRKIDGVNHLWD